MEKYYQETYDDLVRYYKALPPHKKMNVSQGIKARWKL
jgi:hypothetical protein